MAGLLSRSRRAGIVLAISFLPSAVASQIVPRWTATATVIVDGRSAGWTVVPRIAVDRAGHVYLRATYSPPTLGNTPYSGVMVFDSAGTPLRTIGRAGDGPGEFPGAGALGVVGDTLWVAAGNKLQRFSLDGRVIRSVAIPQAKSFKLDGRELRPSSAQRVMAVHADGAFTSQLSLRGNGFFVERGVARVRSNGSVLMAIVPVEGVGISLSRDTDGHMPTVHVDVTPDGRRQVIARVDLATRDTAMVRVTVLGERNDTTWSAAFPAAATGKRRASGTVVPLLDYLLVSRDGTVLLGFDSDGPEVDYLMIDTVGKALATFRLPSLFRPDQFDGESIWGVLSGAKESPTLPLPGMIPTFERSVVRYRVRPP